MAAGRRRQCLSKRGRFWQGHLQQWQQSGLSQAQYCREQGLSAAAFGWWKGRLSRAQTRPEPTTPPPLIGSRKGAFVELTAARGSDRHGLGAAVYEIVLSEHRQLRLGCHFEPERVRQLLALLEERC
jgi:hypothetical protein